MIVRLDKFVSISVYLGLAMALPLLAQQADRARTEALARRAAERFEALQREASQLASQEQTLLGDLRKLEVERQLKAEQFRQLDAQMQQAAADLDVATDRVHALEQQDLAERPGVRARIVEMYKLGQSRYLRLLLSAADLERLGEASRMVAALADLDRKRIADYQRTLGELKATRVELEAHHRQLQTLRAEAQRAQAAADRAAQARAALIGDIDRRRDLNAQLAGEIQSAQAKLQMALRDLASGGPADQTAWLPLRPFRGDLPWPVEGVVRRRYLAAVERGGRSNGVEIASAEGASAKAIHEGEVAFAGLFAGFGNLVIVDHGARAFSLYGNLLDMVVKRGARVERNQQIGTVGPSPAGPPGLYFELRVDGQPVDPLQWLKKR